MNAPKPAAGILAALFAAIALPAYAEGRAELVSCQAMVAHAAQAATPADEAALARCRQIIRDLGAAGLPDERRRKRQAAALGTAQVAQFVIPGRALARARNP